MASDPQAFRLEVQGFGHPRGKVDVDPTLIEAGASYAGKVERL
nr:hypothetical protein [Mycobacterium sp. QGD 101]